MPSQLSNQGHDLLKHPLKSVSAGRCTLQFTFQEQFMIKSCLNLSRVLSIVPEADEFLSRIRIYPYWKTIFCKLWLLVSLEDWCLLSWYCCFCKRNQIAYFTPFHKSFSYLSIVFASSLSVSRQSYVNYFSYTLPKGSLSWKCVKQCIKSFR